MVLLGFVHSLLVATNDAVESTVDLTDTRPSDQLYDLQNRCPRWANFVANCYICHAADWLLISVEFKLEYKAHWRERQSQVAVVVVVVVDAEQHENRRPLDEKTMAKNCANTGNRVKHSLIYMIRPYWFCQVLII